MAGDRMWKLLLLIFALPLAFNQLYAQFSIDNPQAKHYVNDNISIYWTYSNNSNLFWKNSTQEDWQLIKSFSNKENSYSWQLPYISNNTIQLKIETIPDYSLDLIWEEADAHTSEIRSATFSQDMKHIITASDFTIKIWDLISKKLVEEINFSDIGRIRNAIFYRNIDTLFISTDNSIYLYDLKNSAINEIGIENSTMVRYSRVHQYLPLLAYGDHNSNIVLYNIDTEEVVWQRKIEPKDEINSVNFSSTGDSIVFGGGIGQIYVANWADNNEIISFGRHGTESGQNLTIFETSFSECGKFVLSCGVDATIRLWNIDERKEIARFEGHNLHIRSADYLDAQTFISASLDETIRIWNIESGSKLLSLPYGSPVVFSELSPNRDLLLASARNGSFKLWKIFKDKMLSDSLEFLAGYKFDVLSPKVYASINNNLYIPIQYSHNYIIDSLPIIDFSTKLFVSYPIDAFYSENESSAGKLTLQSNGSINSNSLGKMNLISLQGKEFSGTIQIDSIQTIYPELYHFFPNSIDFEILPECISETSRKIIVDKDAKINTFINNKTLSIDVYLVEDGLHSIELFALSGVRVKEIVKGELNYGNHSFNSNINELAKGVYLVVLTTPTSVIIEKIINMD